jgi:gluconolactonase
MADRSVASLMEPIAEGLEFPEGPVALDDGSVIVTEIKGGTIARVDPDGGVERIATVGGGPNGAAFGPDGLLYVCNNGGSLWGRSDDGLIFPGAALARGGNQGPDYVGGSIQTVDIATGEVQTLYTHCDGNPLKAPNDLVFDAQGGLYFTDSGKRRDREADFGALYYARTDGSEVKEIAYQFILANGVGLSPDGDRVYVAETVTARVWAWDITAPGEITGAGPGPGGADLLHTFVDYQMIDSLAVERDGNICIATLNIGAITVINPSGEVVEIVPIASDDPIITNICFGGEDLRTAYVTAAGRGRLYRGEWKRPGLALNL